MNAARTLGLAGIFAAISGCATAPPRPSHVLVVPVSFQVHLIAARQCEARHLTLGYVSPESDANVLLTFAYETHSSSSTTHSYSGNTVTTNTRHSRYQSDRGKAFKCPDTALQQFAVYLERLEQ